jgi:PucR family transcriptional regulator, purine catabolism regulatory protein
MRTRQGPAAPGQVGTPGLGERGRLTLANVIKLDALRQAQPEVVSGADQLDRVVRWVHISEQPDIAKYLKGGELLLTTGMGLGDDGQVHRRFVRSLAQAAVAGVLVRLGGAFSSLPSAFLDEAQALSLPVIVLHHRIGFVEVTEQVHGAIISKQLDMLRRAEDLRRELTELVLSGGTLRQVLGRLADLVANGVVLEDTAHQVVDFALLGRESAKLLNAWARHSRAEHAVSADQAAKLEHSEPDCAWVAIRLRGEEWGRLHVLETHHRLDEIDVLTLDRAAAGVGLALLAEHDARSSAERAGSLLMADLLDRRLPTAEEFLARARSLRLEFKGSKVAALAVELVGIADMITGDPWVPDPHNTRTRLLEHVRAALRAHEGEGLCALDGNRVLAIFRLDGSRSARELVEEVSRDVCERVSSSWSGRIVPVVGASGETPLEQARRALQQAAEAATYGTRVTDRDAVYHYDDLGVYRLLMQFADGPELASYVEAELGPLLEHDARSRLALLPTLRIFLDHGGGTSASARELFVERRTVYHRLTAIQGLLGRDLSDPDTRLRLGVALRALDLLQGRASAAPAGRPGQLAGPNSARIWYPSTSNSTACGGCRLGCQDPRSEAAGGRCNWRRRVPVFDPVPLYRRTTQAAGGIRCYPQRRVWSLEGLRCP